jgi:hypothetical protein
MKRTDFTSDILSLVFTGQSVENLTDTYVKYTFQQLEEIVENAVFPSTAETKIFDVLQGLQDLITLADKDIIERSDQVLTVRFKEGNPDQIYAPALFASKPDADGNVSMVLKVGNTQIRVSDEFTFGDLQGDQPSVSVTKVEGGKERINCTIKFKNKTAIYIIPCVIAEGVTGDRLEESLDVGHHLKGFLRELGSGKSYLKLKDLELGIYPILDILEPEGKKYGRFEIVLAEGNVTPNAALNKALEAFLSTGESLESLRTFFKGRSLKIVSKTEKDNKVFVNAVFTNASSTNTLKGASVKAIAPPAASDIVVQAKSQVAVVDEFPV